MTDIESKAIEYPRNIPAEQAILGALLINNAMFYKICSFLKTEHFHEPVHQRIYAAISQKITEGALVTPLTVKLEFDADPALKAIGGSEYLARLATSATTVMNIKSYADEILLLSKRRRLIDLCKEAIADAQDVTIDRSVSEIESEMSKKLADVINDTAGTSFETSKQVAARVADSLKAPLNCFSTGIERLDAAMLGGLYARRMYSISGRMKDGKSIWATTIAYNMAKLGTKVFFLTLEMENEEIQTRFLSRSMKVKPSRFFYDRDDEHFQELAAKHAVRTNSDIIMKYEPDITFDRMKQRLHYAVHNRGVKGFILDQWQLVGGKRKGDSQANHLSEVAQWLAGFCKNENVFGVVVCQLNKDGTTLDSEGIKRAVDQHYKINRCKADEQYAYLDLEISRYTAKGAIGSETDPAFALNLNGLFFEPVEGVILHEPAPETNRHIRRA